MSNELWRFDECIVFGNGDPEWGWLSNFSPRYPFEYRGQKIKYLECMYQFMKHLDFEPELAEEILACDNPKLAKKLGRSKLCSEHWVNQRESRMRICLAQKFWTNPKANRALLATGDRPIVEFSKYDDFWGAKHFDFKRLKGQNVLGKLLMEVRKELVEGEPFLQIPPYDQQYELNL